MEYEQIFKKIEQNLCWLNANARHAIELQETFLFPAYDTTIRESIKNTNKVRCYKVCLDALYFEFVMTLMRMFDSYEHDTICLQNVFELLSDDFVKHFEIKNKKEIRNEINLASNQYEGLKGSHLVARLSGVRHKHYAHTATNFDRNQFADYGHAEELLKKTLPMLNNLNFAILGKTESFDQVENFWKGYAVEFWQDG